MYMYCINTCISLDWLSPFDNGYCIMYDLYYMEFVFEFLGVGGGRIEHIWILTEVEI